MRRRARTLVGSVAIAAVLSLTSVSSASAEGYWQCVPFARIASGIQIRGIIWPFEFMVGSCGITAPLAEPASCRPQRLGGRRNIALRQCRQPPAKMCRQRLQPLRIRGLPIGTQSRFFLVAGQQRLVDGVDTDCRCGIGWRRIDFAVFDAEPRAGAEPMRLHSFLHGESLEPGGPPGTSGPWS